VARKRSAKRRRKMTTRKPARKPFSRADENWLSRRDLFYGVCNILDGCHRNAEHAAAFRRQKASMEKRFGYDKEPVTRITEEYRFSPAEFRRMKAAIRRNLRLPEPVWSARKEPESPATPAPCSELMSQS
jgi:hypothetical protein